MSIGIVETQTNGRTIPALAIVLVSHFVVGFQPAHHPMQWFVAASFTGTTDGSVERPFRTIRAAVAAARAGDTIAVSQGSYTEGTVDLRSKALTLLGGFTVEVQDGSRRFATRNPAVTPTIVIGASDTQAYPRERGAVFLLGQSNGARIDGFTITGGRHGIFAEYSASAEPLVIANNIIENNGVGTPAYDEYGGGIHSEYPTLVISNNVIRDNRSGRGGGVAALGSGDARIELNVIERNVALGDHGGGVYVQQPATVRDNIIRSNAVTAQIVDWMGGVGGGITIVGARAWLSGNLVTDNYAKKCGGGVFLDEAATATLTRETVIGNRPAHRDGWGGAGIYVDGSADAVTTVRIEESVILDNAPNGPGVGNGIFAASRAHITLKGCVIQSRGMTTDLDLAIVDETGTSFITGTSSTATRPVDGRAASVTASRARR